MLLTPLFLIKNIFIISRINKKLNPSIIKKKPLLFLAIIFCYFNTNAQNVIMFEDFNVEPTNIIPLSYEYLLEEENPWNWISLDSDGIEDNAE